MSEHVENGCQCEVPLDREPTPDLGVLTDIYARYLVGGASAEGKKAAQIILDAVPQLVEELREAREQLAYWRGLPIREEYAITDGRHPNEAGVVWPGSSEDAQRLAQDPDRRPWVRSLTVHPWQDLTEAPS